MRILLYNIRYGTGHRRGYHLPFPYSGFFKKTTKNLQKITGFIRSVDPDIIGLIEVDAGSYRANNMCQAESIATDLGYDYVVETKYLNNSFALRLPVLNRQSNAVLTKEKITNHHFHYFNKGMKKLVITAEIDRVIIFLVHLSLKYRHRQIQLAHLHRLLQTTTKEVIVAGDFNTFFGKQELQLFLAATHLQSANTEDMPSHPSHSPHRQIDFILHSPGIRIDSFSIPNVRYSDHSPLICDFSFTTEVQSSL